ncbi:MAG: potassium transporter Kup [Magnetococcales bacterium]|nr:potassium transporter Kup [Magnetococcales bacterium]
MKDHTSFNAALVVGAIGVVYGDIGTSPLYAMKETFNGPHALPVDAPHVFGVLSLIFWAVTIIVSLKYVTLMMLADNKGEGGSLALLALVSRLTEKSRLSGLVVVLGIFAAALFYGDSMITPAISVLSAVEGLEVVAPAMNQAIVPITIVILIALFSIQSQGTKAVGFLFGPVMLVWFAVLGLLGVIEILHKPEVLAAFDPRWAFRFLAQDGWKAFLALGSVVLALTGAEALYADMGHFGKGPIRFSWFAIVFPCLMLNYFGQGAMMLGAPETAINPFFHLAPDWAALPMVILATAATIIASQAVISGAFSVTQQAIQLGFLPRMSIRFTSETEMGQIYVPFINWSLLLFVILLVLGFGTSSNLAAAYGVAVTGTMTIDTVLLGFVMLLLWKWSRIPALALLALFLTVDLAFFLANSVKIFHGGWFPLAIAFTAFILLTTWKKGRGILYDRLRRENKPLLPFIESVSETVLRVPGTAIFMSGAAEGAPSALLHNHKHNNVLHQRIVLVTVTAHRSPFVPCEERMVVETLGSGVFRVLLKFGFMETPDVPGALIQCVDHGLPLDPEECSFFLSRETLIPTSILGMPLWRGHLFAWMARNAASPMDFFRLPPDRVVEMGIQVEI